MTRHTVELLEQGLNSDVLLYCCLFAVSTVLIRVLPFPRWSDIWSSTFGAVQREIAGPGPFSLETAALAFKSYERAANADIQRMRSSYTRMSWAHRRTGASLGYPKKLEALTAATRMNACLAQSIADLAVDEFFLDPESFKGRQGGSLPRTREALRHFVRDWSTEGAEERNRIFGPILEVLDEVPPEERDGLRVLVPGSGLGRLAWEISQLGTSVLFSTGAFRSHVAYR
jgi:hypothetical protein